MRHILFRHVLPAEIMHFTAPDKILKKIIEKRAFENLQNKLKIIEVDANNDVINMH